jgi:glycosyltransferase involved in cell wall biosynthesis
MKPVLWTKLRCGQLCKDDKLDIFWGAATFLPNLPKTVRTIITVYDLNFKIVPETMSRLHRLAYQLYFKADILKADCVTTISKGTSDRLYEYYGRSTDVVVYPAVGMQFKREPESSIRKTLEKYAVKRPYLLAVGTREPRKNIELLVRAFLEIKGNGVLVDHKLVLVGGRGWKDQRLSELISCADSITPLGYVPDEHLAPLYSGADVFIFPSIYEGYGMPVAEARACGAKVVASDTPELREAAGQESIYVRATSEDIQQGILKALAQTNPKGNIDLANTYSWKASAKILVSSIKQLRKL